MSVAMPSARPDCVDDRVGSMGLRAFRGSISHSANAAWSVERPIERHVGPDVVVTLDARPTGRRRDARPRVSRWRRKRPSSLTSPRPLRRCRIDGNRAHVAWRRLRSSLNRAFSSGAGRGIRQSRRNFLPPRSPSRAHQAGPGGARERAADADAAHTETGEIVDRKVAGQPIRKLTGFGATASTTASISSRVLMPGA